jgi:predicted metalloprotease
MVLYDGATRTGCGIGQAATGPFYCPEDHKLYLDLSFFRDMQQKLGAPGDFAQAYVIAHEVGHHLQALTGQMRGAPGEGASGGSVRTELQADCYAGVWANRANARFGSLEAGDIEEALGAAAAVGDDRLQQESRGHVTPDSFTHGTSAQRAHWFTRGFKSGRMEDCDTFGASEL